jgi:hypothetical protein
MANNQSITISQRKRVNNHVSYNTNTNLIPTTTTSTSNVVVANTHSGDNNNNNEVSLDISNIRKKVDSKLNTSLITNNFTRNEVASSNTNEQHTELQHTKKITPIIMCVIPTETIKDDEMISERKDLTTNTYHNNKKPSKCKVSCDRICIIRFLCIFVISFSLFLFLKWKLHF